METVRLPGFLASDFYLDLTSGVPLKRNCLGEIRNREAEKVIVGIRLSYKTKFVSHAPPDRRGAKAQLLENQPALEVEDILELLRVL